MSSNELGGITGICKARRRDGERAQLFRELFGCREIGREFVELVVPEDAAQRSARDQLGEPDALSDGTRERLAQTSRPDSLDEGEPQRRKCSGGYHGFTVLSSFRMVFSTDKPSMARAPAFRSSMPTKFIDAPL